MVCLIRYAHAGDKPQWPGRDHASLRWAKGSTWVLDTNQGRVVGARHLAPLRLKDLAGRY